MSTSTLRYPIPLLRSSSSRVLASRCKRPCPVSLLLQQPQPPQVRRRARFFSTSTLSTLTEQDVEVFRSILQNPEPAAVGRDDITNPTTSSTNLIYQDDERLEPFRCDWTNHYRGTSELVLLPSSPQQVSQILQHCHERRLGVVPQGGNTGLVGGSVGSGIVVSTRRLNQIHALNVDEGVLTCQSGCILQELQGYAAAQGWLVPIDLGAKGTCQIGGNVSTNAGGIYYYRYGSLASNLLGLQVVTANGRVLNLGSSLRKDNTGYKLHNLLLGAEGTLGVITEVTLQCHALPSSKQAVWLACPNYDSVLQVRRTALRMLGEILSAMEWMDDAIVKIVVSHQPSFQSMELVSSSSSCPYHVLIETHGANEQHDADKLNAFVEHLLSHNLATDGLLAQSVQQHDQFWKLRESCNPAMASTGYTYKYDVSLSVSDFDACIAEIQQQVQEYDSSGGNHDDGADNNTIVVAKWGHILDGNLHLNVHRAGIMEPDPELATFLDSVVYDAVLKRRGSVSAEHGIGVAKKAYLHRVHDEVTLNAMKDLKQHFDPHGILNPGKIF